MRVGASLKPMLQGTWVAAALALLCTARVLAADLPGSAEAVEPDGFTTPRAVLRHFEQAMQAADFDGAMRCMDLSRIPPGVRDEIGERLALQLALVLERVPPVELEDAPKEDSLLLAGMEAGDVSLRRRTFAGGDRLWQFSARTIDALPRIFRSVMNQPVMAPSEATEASERRSLPVLQWRSPEVALWLSLPDWLKRHAMGLELYQWIGLPFVLGLSLLIGRVVQPPVRGLLLRLSHVGRRGTGIDWSSLVGNCARVAAWSAGIQLAAWLVLLLGLPLGALDPVLVGLQVANVALLAVLAMQVVDFVAAVIRSRDHADAALRSLDDLLVVSLARIGKIVLVAVAVVWVVSILGAESSVNRLLAGLGIGGIAFALALQEPLKNFFSSLVLAADRPFGVGDEVTVDGVKGKVEHVGFRTTTLRTKTRTRLVVPNATVVSAKLEASEAGVLKEFKAVLPIAFEADAAALDGLRQRSLHLLEQAPGVHAGSVEVGISALGLHGIEFTATGLFAKGPQPLWQVFDGLHAQLLGHARELGLPLRAAPVR